MFFRISSRNATYDTESRHPRYVATGPFSVGPLGAEGQTLVDGIDVGVAISEKLIANRYLHCRLT
ncbi:hypothetical protein CVT26_001234 [Gymnopilus dilepis]|uniref:Uncharacterized protein n=1 Tax=Gymnopilus dilepis TaxID=231916 RepID=A0A409X5P5_9AGAR|nr:hypothetical protein CVT26_001234 [Gymnopilus dilepis]